MLIIWFANGGGGAGETQLGDDIIGTVLLNMAVFGAMLSYIVQALSFILLRRNQPNIERPFRSPLGIPGAVVTIIIAAVTLFYQMQDPNFFKGVIWVVAVVRGRHRLFRPGRPQQADPVAGRRVRARAPGARRDSCGRRGLRPRPRCTHITSERSFIMAASYTLAQLKADVAARHHRYRARRLSRHAGPADRQALPGRVLPRRRHRRDAWLRLSAGQRHRYGAGPRLRGRQLGQRAMAISS